MKQLDIQIWSDIACPWCYIGKRRLEAALAGFPHREAVAVTWRAFELDTAAPRMRDTSVPYAERLAQKYGTTPERAEGMIRNVTRIAEAEGLDFHYEKIRPGNTFDAHRLLHLAADRGQGEVAQERLLRAYMTEGEPIGDPETLVRLAGDVGLVADEVRAMLAGDAYASAVRADEAEAHELGIHGVPFFVFDRRIGVSGAQPAALLREVLDRTWAELPDDGEHAGVSEGAVCGPDGCV